MIINIKYSGNVFKMLLPNIFSKLYKTRIWILITTYNDLYRFTEVFYNIDPVPYVRDSYNIATTMTMPRRAGNDVPSRCSRHLRDRDTRLPTRHAVFPFASTKDNNWNNNNIIYYRLSMNMECYSNTSYGYAVWLC